jgi:glutamate-1-semialdehyde 2,1-aminomutase
MGEESRRIAEQAFAAEGIPVICTGGGNEVVPPSSITRVYFPHRADHVIHAPDDTWDPSLCDIALTEQVLRLAMLLEGVHVIHGLGGVTAAHTADDLRTMGEAFGSVARRLHVS